MQGKVVAVSSRKHQILYRDTDGSVRQLSTPELKPELNPEEAASAADELKAPIPIPTLKPTLKPKPKPKPRVKRPTPKPRDKLGDNWHEPKRTATAVSLMSQAKGPGRATLGNADSAGFGNFQVLDANPAYAKLDGLSSSKFICGYNDPGVADLYNHMF